MHSLVHVNPYKYFWLQNSTYWSSATVNQLKNEDFMKMWLFSKARFLIKKKILKIANSHLVLKDLIILYIHTGINRKCMALLIKSKRESAKYWEFHLLKHLIFFFFLTAALQIMQTDQWFTYCTPVYKRMPFYAWNYSLTDSQQFWCLSWHVS